MYNTAVELIVLGSGSAFAQPGPVVRNPAGYALRLGKDILLFDLGFGNLRQLLRAGLDPSDITDLFLSHRHPDHIGDLPALLFMFKYELKPKSGRLRLWGPAGIKEFWQILEQAFIPWLSPEGYDLEIRELKSKETVRKSNWSAKTLTTLHPTPTLAYRLTSKGKSLVYSADTGFTHDLAAFASKCDLFLLECTKAAGDRYRWHLGFKAAKLLAELSGCRRALLTHLSPASEVEVRQHVSRKILMAHDLMKMRI